MTNSFSHAVTPETYWAPLKRHQRIDIEHRNYAMSIGYETKLHVEDRYRGHSPRFPITFVRGNRWVWHTERGWCIAWLTGDQEINYRYHRYFKNLMDALDYVPDRPAEPNLD